jgi:hypothetical protein
MDVEAYLLTISNQIDGPVAALKLRFYRTKVSHLLGLNLPSGGEMGGCQDSCY